MDRVDFEIDVEVEKVFQETYGGQAVKRPNRKRRVIRRKLLRKLGIKQGVKYEDYIKSAQWKKKRQDFISLHRTKRCELCCKKDGLVVHHHSYVRLGVEKFNDLALLCKDCHHRIHFFEDGTKTPLATKVLRERYKVLSKKTFLA